MSETHAEGGHIARVAGASHVFLAVTMIGLGLQGLIQGEFPPTWSGVPKSLPAREALAYLCAIVSLVTGTGLLWRRTAVRASRVLLAYFLVWLVLFRVSRIVLEPSALVSWWASGDTAVMVAGVWALRVRLAGDGGGRRTSIVSGDSGLRIARASYGLGLIPFGVAHFVNLSATASLVPTWLPWHVAWATLTGIAFVAAGIAVLTGVYARTAATLSALQLGLFTLLVWVPVVVTGPSAFQWSEFVDSWALTAGAWVVADSYAEVPWLAVGTR